MEHRAGSQVIKANVPLSEMFGYATHMRSSTQGRATYSMHFNRYEEAPRSVSEEIIGRNQERLNPEIGGIMQQRQALKLRIERGTRWRRRNLTGRSRM